MIKFIDLERQREAIEPKVSDAINKVIKSSSFIMGPEVEKLESALSSYIGQQCVTVANGTDALYIALKSLGIGIGDEVIVPSFTWVSTAEVVCQIGASPVFVDVNDDFLINLKMIEEKISSKTKAIIPVSMFGRCPDLIGIEKIAKKNEIFTIEDAAQSFGAKIDGSLSCSVLDISTTSFFPSKPLGCYGDGGAIFSKHEHLFNKLKIIPRHGQRSRYDYVELGLNSRLDTIQAAILLEKLNIFDAEIEARNEVASQYNKMLCNYNLITLPKIPSGQSSSVWAQYTILLDREISSSRHLIMEDLAKLNIPTALYYPVPLHTSKIFENYASDNLPNTLDLSDRVLSLPMHPYLSSSEVGEVSNKLIEVISNYT